MVNEIYGQNLEAVRKKFDGWAKSIEEKSFKKMRG